MINYARYLSDDRFAIFLIHGVAEGRQYRVRNYTKKHISRERFITILDELSATGTAVSMDDVLRAHDGSQALPKRSFVITFDDGFANNASVAAPVLARLRTPATFYVTTDFVDENKPSWIDLIEYAFERADVVRLDIPALGGSLSCATSEEKIALLDRIRSYVKGDSRIDPTAFAQSIWEQLGAVAFEPDPELDQKLSWNEVRELDREPLFSVGGHGKTHAILEYLGDEGLQSEIDTSISRLTHELSHPIRHYSYPEGLPHCYSDRVIRLLKARGILAAPSAIEGVNAAGDDLFHLRRIMVV